jgi:hypothetical protein
LRENERDLARISKSKVTIFQPNETGAKRNPQQGRLPPLVGSNPNALLDGTTSEARDAARGTAS